MLSTAPSRGHHFFLLPAANAQAALTAHGTPSCAPSSACRHRSALLGMCTPTYSALHTRSPLHTPANSAVPANSCLVSRTHLDTSGRHTHLPLSENPHAIYRNVPSCLEARVTRRLCLRSISAGVDVYLDMLKCVSEDAGTSRVTRVLVASGA